MKTYLQHIIFLTGIIICLSGCIDENGSMTEADFVSKTSDISLTIKGKMQMQYDSRKHQLAFSAKECMFRVMDDDLNNYFNVSLDRMPQNTGDVIPGTVIYTTDNDILQVSAEFTVSALKDDMVWLWDGSSKVGAVVQILR